MMEKYVAVLCYKEEDCLYNTEASGEFDTALQAEQFIYTHRNDKHFDFGIVEKRYRKYENK